MLQCLCLGMVNQLNPLKTLAKQVMQYGQKTGLDKHCGAYHFCKAAVSATRASSSADDQICQDLANLLMEHQKSTADKYYYLEDKMQSALRAAEKLPMIMCSGKSTLVKTSVSKNVSDNVEQDSNLSTSNASSSKNLKYFSEKDIKDLKEIYSEEIISKKKLSYLQIRAKWIKNPVIAHLQCRQV